VPQNFVYFIDQMVSISFGACSVFLINVMIELKNGRNLAFDFFDINFIPILFTVSVFEWQLLILKLF